MWVSFERKITISKHGFRVNEQIRADSVRLIDENNQQLGIVERYIAANKAREAGLDLVEVAPASNPPVCRIMDYGKWLYEEKRKKKESRKKSLQHNIAIKEVRMRPETDPHDLEIKINHARKFLEKGHKVQFTMMFRGRQMLHQDLAREVFDQVNEALEDIAKIDRPAKMSSRRMIQILSPR